MAAASEVAAFRAAHTVAETMAHFGIAERSVYKAVARARRPGRAPGGAVDGSSASRSPALSSSGAPAAAQFPVIADDVAGDNTYWRCPVSGELLPVVPGSHRRAWMEERRRLWSRPAAVEVAAPVEVPAAVEVAAPAPVAVRLPAAVDAPAPAPAPVHVAAGLPDVLEVAAPAPAPVAAAAVVPGLVRHNLWPAILGWLAVYWRVPVALALALVLVMAAF